MAVFTEQTKLNTGVQVARLSITQAIEQSGISRTHFYTHYIKKGLISVSEHSGKKYIDSSELVRVFPDLATEQPPNNTVHTQKHSPEQEKPNNTEQGELVKLLREQLNKAEQREQQHLAHINALTLRLEAPVATKKQGWFSRFWNAKDDE